MGMKPKLAIIILCLSFSKEEETDTRWHQSEVLWIPCSKEKESGAGNQDTGA